MKVAIYTRVSTVEQNVDTQLNLLRTLCKRCNYEVYKEYNDVGQSGKKHSRPQFDLMLNDMRKFKFKGILVYKLDRIGRSLAHLITLFSEFEKKSIDFISATQNIDTTTPEGRMFMRMLMVLAEYERELTVSRVKSGMDRARKEGKQIGRSKVKTNDYLILRLLNSNKSQREIAKELNISKGTVQNRIKKMGWQKVQGIYK